MKVIAPDHERRYDVPGAPGPARRPVEIDASNTGFTRLRSLRLYRFDTGSVIDGHAEEDEVFVAVTAGAVEMKIGWEDSAVDAVGTYTLSAPSDASAATFVAYLPPRSVYRLTARTTADILYARATPTAFRSPAVFTATAFATSPGVTTLLDERTHAERLRLKVERVRGGSEQLTLDLPGSTDAGCEALVHVQGSPAESVGSVAVGGGSSLRLRSWETVVLPPGEHAAFHPAPGEDLLIITVSAA